MTWHQDGAQTTNNPTHQAKQGAEARPSLPLRDQLDRGDQLVRLQHDNIKLVRAGQTRAVKRITRSRAPPLKHGIQKDGKMAPPPNGHALRRPQLKERIGPRPAKHLHLWLQREHKRLAIAIILLGGLPRHTGITAEHGLPPVTQDDYDGVRAFALGIKRVQADTVAHGGVHHLPVTSLVSGWHKGV